MQILRGFLPIFIINPGILKNLEDFTQIHVFLGTKNCNSTPYCIRKYIIEIFKWNAPTEFISTHFVMSRRPLTFINNDFSSQSQSRFCCVTIKFTLTVLHQNQLRIEFIFPTKNLKIATEDGKINVIFQYHRFLIYFLRIV